MKPSHFYSRTLQKTPVVLSFLFTEILQDILSKEPEVTLESVIARTAQQAFDRKLTAAELQATAEQVLLAKEEFEAAQVISSETQEKYNKSLGTDLIKWLTALNPYELCLVLANYDLSRAEELYCHTDYRAVVRISEVYLEQQWQVLKSTYEAVMYGFGGGYKDDKAVAQSNEGNVRTVDLTGKNKDEGLKALRGLGF